MNRQTRLFITGTDTGVGKTVVARIVADLLAEYGSVGYCKPVQSGAERNEKGELLAPDFIEVMKGRAVQFCDTAVHVPYCFEPACSPHLAAELSHSIIDPGHIIACVNEIASRSDFVIIEGAGGLMVPLGETYYMIDLIEALAAPVVLVTTSKLGTLNHTFLSFSALVSRGLKVAAVVYNDFSPDTPTYIKENNSKIIRRFISPVPLLEVNRKRELDPATKELWHEKLVGLE